MKYNIVSNVEIEKVGVQEYDDYVIYNPQNDTVFVVNNIGGEILKKIENGIEVDEIVNYFMTIYNETHATIKKDIIEFLEMMTYKGYVIKH